MVAGSRLFFIALDGTSRVLGATDGTTSGTRLLSEVGPGSASGLTAVGDRAFFVVHESGTQTSQLWMSDGVSATPVKSWSAPFVPGALTAIGETLRFVMYESTSGAEIWRSDGTEAGTKLLKDIHPGAFGSGADHLRLVSERVFFSAGDGPSGTALWRTNGTTEGTIKVAEIATGPTSASPRGITRVAETLFFFANDEPTGLELHALSLTAQFVASLQLVVR